MRPSNVALLGFLIASSAFAQSTANGSLSGSVQDSQGGASLAGAQIRYRKVIQQVKVHGVMLPAPGETTAGGQLSADAGGAFSLANLPAGTYMLCASVPSSPYLDPCVWRQAVPVAVSSGADASVTMSLQKGVYLNVRINDPLGLLPQSVDGPFTPHKLLVGVTYANGAYQGATNTSVDSAGRNYRLIIPAGVPFRLWLYSGSVTLADTAGNQVGTSGAQVSFQAAGGQDQAFTFKVTGTQAP